MKQYARCLRVAIFGWLLAYPAGAGAAVLPLDTLPGDQELLSLLWANAPELVAAHSQLQTSAANVVRAETLPNPALTFAWNNVALGATNPMGLNPTRDTTNYQAQLAMLIEIAKRGPRQEAARLGRTAALSLAADSLRQVYLRLIENLAEIAAARMRITALADLAADAEQLYALQTERFKRGDAAGIDADRSRVEAELFDANLAEEQQRWHQALLDCSRMTGLQCQPFGELAATRFLETYGQVPTVAAAELSNTLPERPDLQALSATEQSARASVTLAERRIIPDLTLGVGYVRDHLVVAGNQPNTLFVNVSMPLPVFERGQADAADAAAAANAAAAMRATLFRQGTLELQELQTRAETLHAKRTRLNDVVLPLAEGVVEQLSKAVRVGGASLQDLLLARRNYGELLTHAADLSLASVRLTAALARSSGRLPLGQPFPHDPLVVPQEP